MATQPKTYFDGMMKVYNAIPKQHTEARNAAKTVIEKHLGRTSPKSEKHVPGAVEATMKSYKTNKSKNKSSGK